MQAGGQGQAAVRLLIENYESLGDRTTHSMRCATWRFYA